MKKVQITETVLRDANQSLMATRLPYSDFADILPEMNKAGYYSVECWGGATFDSCLRYLGEDPWQRLRDIRKAMPDTKLQMLLRGQNLLGYKHYHDDVVEKFVELSIKNGIDILRIFDALNDFRNIATALEATKKYATKNTVASGCISYTQSPVHTVEKYVEMCKELKNMGFDTICLKDMAGTMSPYEAEHLIKGIKDAVGDMPLILHTHCTTGMAYMTVTKAIESGIDVIDCATSCFSNGTIRAILDGTVFRTPILVKGIEPYIPTWTAPITIARHAYGDVYKNTEMKVKQGSKAELVVTDAEGKETRELIFNFEDTDGIIQGLHNKNNSIAGFARACFNYGLDLHQDVWFATKDTISKKYDHTFKDIFQEIYDNEYKEKFEAVGIEYFYTLIDDAVARVIRSHGGYIWACKNYDGDVMSDMVSTAYGSLAMMTSVLVSPDGIYEYEAAHGTVQRHYYKYLKGEETSTNSVATIFAWSGAMRKRGELDKLPELAAFADKLEKATIQTIEDGVMTGDLYLISKLENKKKVNSKEFLEAIRERLDALMA